MSALKIVNPCTENWNNMLPAKDGAWCQSCEKNIIDFSTMTPNEIKRKLAGEENGSVCGRIRKDQLLRLNSDFDDWNNRSRQKLQSKFVLAVLIVFGLTLFSCSEEDKKKIERETEKWVQVIPVSDQLEIASAETEIIQEIEPMDDQAELIKEVDLAVCTFTDESDVFEVNYSDRETMMLGGFGWAVEYNEYLVQETSSDTLKIKEETQEEIDLANLPKFSANVFPNPAISQSTLDLEIVSDTQYTIAIYDMNGSLVTFIFSGELNTGQHRFDLDVSSLNSGTYFITIGSSEMQETIKLMKVN